jgi:DNA repair protein RadC
MSRIPIYRLFLVREGSLPSEAPLIRSPGDAALLFRHYLQGADRETLVCLLLDARARVQGVHTISIGTLTESPVHPREVFKAAITGNAVSLILGHNHPSGDPEPSPEDIATTRRLVEAGRALGIEVVDHLILGEPGYTSLKERQLL